MYLYLCKSRRLSLTVDHKNLFGNAECEVLVTEAKESVAIISFANLPIPILSDVD